MKKGLLLLSTILLSLSLFANGGEEKGAASGDKPYEFTIFAKWQPEETEADAAYFKGIEEALNLKINFEIPPQANYAERQQIMMATGDFPELVLFNGTDDKTYVDAVKNELVMPLNDYLPGAPNIMKYSYQVSLDSFKTMNDDRIFGIPRTSVARADGFNVRGDWVKNLGIDWVKDGGTLSLDQFTELNNLFAHSDPDGNGLDDTYGMQVSLDPKTGAMAIPGHVLWSYGCIGWQEYEGTYIDLKYSRDHDNFKKALAYAHQMWEDKVVDPDWPTLTMETAKDRWTSATYYGMRGEFAGWIMNQQAEMQQFVPETELIYITGIENEGGAVKGGSYSTGTWGLWGIMATTEMPEKVVGMLDYALSDDYWTATSYGPEGVTWNQEGDKKVPTDIYQDHKRGRGFVRRNNAPEFFISLNTEGTARERLIGLIGTCIDQAVFSKSEGFRPSAADSQSYLDADTELEKMISKIIVGQEPVSAWDAALDEWYANGGAEYIKEMQDHIKSKN